MPIAFTVMGECGFQQRTRLEECRMENVPIGFLPIGNLACWLRRSGVNTLGDLTAVSEKEILSMPGLGYSTSARVLEAARLFLKCIDGSRLDWPLYSQLSGLAILPYRIPTKSSEFMLSIYATMTEAAELMPASLDRILMQERILKSANARSRYTELCDRPDVGVTSPALRTRQRDLLFRLLRAVSGIENGRFPFLFHPDYIRMWREACKSAERTKAKLSAEAMSNANDVGTAQSRNHHLSAQIFVTVNAAEIGRIPTQIGFTD